MKLTGKQQHFAQAYVELAYSGGFEQPFRFT